MRHRIVITWVLLSATCFAAAPESAPRPRAEIYADLMQRHGDAELALQSAKSGVARIEALLDQFDLTDENLARLINEATAKRDELKLSVAELQQLLQRLQDLLKLDADAVAAALERALAEREELRDEVKQREAELEEITEDEELQQAISLDGMASRPFLLTGDRIAPFSEPFFRAELIKVRLADRRVVERPRYTRESDAGSIAAAVQPGGALYALVNAPDFDPNETYVQLWVCDDAIAGYRTVVSFLKRNRVRYTWTPDVDAPWTALDEESELGTWGYGG